MRMEPGMAALAEDLAEAERKIDNLKDIMEITRAFAARNQLSAAVHNDICQVFGWPELGVGVPQ